MNTYSHDIWIEEITFDYDVASGLSPVFTGQAESHFLLPTDELQMGQIWDFLTSVHFGAYWSDLIKSNIIFILFEVKLTQSSINSSTQGR